MVERVEWMSPIDYEIMLFLEEHDILVSPKVVASNIDYERVYTNSRMRVLREAGLLEQDEEDGLYELSDRGRAYLAGKLEAEHLERDE